MGAGLEAGSKQSQVAAFITPPVPLSPHAQSAGITLPTDSQVTALVPSESAIRRLSPEDQAFWLQPRALPQLVRWAAGAGARGGDEPSV